ncbi:Mitochondrial porin [Tilletia horrida]|uniref:Mitochondrial porin n=1 Tax=Tilletia horrida TaxID=155126 RepID=A0AAN6GKV0_9BASI|nr:Mitochondrial porin [Tilletia horrida]KAK0549925.1 Mitochondrial porin [Tilletia horrida]KAK0563059.1 Mitochondrial porin [Tilletia horrida]
MSQPVPPSWKDLGKLGNDLLSKDYPLNSQLEVKTRTPNNVTFRVLGVRDNKSGSIAGDLEGKFEDKKNGIAYTQAWTTANALRSHVELENHIAKGLKLEVIGTLLPDKQTKNALFSSSYKQPGVHTRQHLDLFKGPTFTADAVVGRDGFLAGAEAAYDVKSGKVSKYNLAAGFSTPEYAVTLHALGNLSTYSASYYHRVNQDIEVSARATHSAGAAPGQVNLEVGTKTYLDNAAFVKGKINNAGVLVLGYTQALRPGVKASFGLALDTVKLNSGHVEGSPAAHKFGTSLTFEA